MANLINNQLNIEVRDTVFDPSLPRSDDSPVHWRKDSGKLEYKVWLYLEGNDLPYIQSVTYTLHQDFRNPNRTVSRSPANPNCQLVIWTPGLFTVKVTILDKKGFSYEVAHLLAYDQELPPWGDRYVPEEEDRSSSSRPTPCGLTNNSWPQQQTL